MIWFSRRLADKKLRSKEVRGAGLQHPRFQIPSHNTRRLPGQLTVLLEKLACSSFWRQGR
jgi:hypothetical protein